jgi:hypothetical protein
MNVPSALDERITVPHHARATGDQGAVRTNPDFETATPRYMLC